MYITEQSGARWLLSVADRSIPGRAFWCWLLEGNSSAMPGVVGFYAESIDAVCNALNN